MLRVKQKTYAKTQNNIFESSKCKEGKLQLHSAERTERFQKAFFVEN